MKRYMEKSFEQLQKIEAALAAFRPETPELELPIEPNFISYPPRVDPQLMFERCEEMLQYRTSNSDFERQRLAGRCNEEFIL